MAGRPSTTVVICLAVLAAVAVPAMAAPTEGFLDSGLPILAEGTISLRSADPTLLLTNPNGGVPASPILLTAEHATLTRVYRDYTVATGAGLGPDTNLPSAGAERQTFELSDVTLEVSAIETDADLLLAPGEATGFAVVGATEGGPVLLDVAPDGLRVIDGYRKTVGERRAGDSSDIEFEYTTDPDQVTATGLEDLVLAGSTSGYVWGAHVLVRNASGEVLSVQTGYERTESASGLTWNEHYEYLLLELTGVEATVRPGSLESVVAAPALSAEVAGALALPDASGTLTTEDAFYRAPEPQDLALTGTFHLDVTPRDAGRSTVRLTGELATVSLPAIEGVSGLPVPLVAVGAASGATLLGVAAWYILSAKGLVLAAPLLRRRSDESASQPAPGAPGELLFDTDRFTLYHLVQARAGLSAADCLRITGIRRAGDHLEALAAASLLVPIAEEPRRYALPGSLTERRASRVVLLRSDRSAFELARLLALYGLTSEARLLERAVRVVPGLKPRDLSARLASLTSHGLVHREPGADGPVVDPTEELFACLRAMGETPAPLA